MQRETLKGKKKPKGMKSEIYSRRVCRVTPGVCRLALSPRLWRRRRVHGHLVPATLPLAQEWLRVWWLWCGWCDWLCFLSWVTVWAGCLCFWVLGLGLVVPAAESAASVSVGSLGLWVFVIGGIVWLKGKGNF